MVKTKDPKRAHKNLHIWPLLPVPTLIILLSGLLSTIQTYHAPHPTTPFCTWCSLCLDLPLFPPHCFSPLFHYQSALSWHLCVGQVFVVVVTYPYVFSVWILNCMSFPLDSFNHYFFSGIKYSVWKIVGVQSMFMNKWRNNINNLCSKKSMLVAIWENKFAWTRWKVRRGLRNKYHNQARDDSCLNCTWQWNGEEREDLNPIK